MYDEKIGSYYVNHPLIIGDMPNELYLRYGARLSNIKVCIWIQNQQLNKKQAVTTGDWIKDTVKAVLIFVGRKKMKIRYGLMRFEAGESERWYKTNTSTHIAWCCPNAKHAISWKVIHMI